MAVDGTAIRVRMAELGINSIEELSNLSGVNRNTISNVLNNKHRPNALTIDKLYKALQLTPEQGGEIFFNNKLA